MDLSHIAGGDKKRDTATLENNLTVSYNVQNTHYTTQQYHF